jgi:hypothetical protein
VEIVIPEGRGRARLSVDKLGAVGEPGSLTWWKQTTQAMLPSIELPDLLFEVHSCTGFLDAFDHVSERRTRFEAGPSPAAGPRAIRRPRRTAGLLRYPRRPGAGARPGPR